MRAGQTHGPRRVLMTADTVGGVWTFATELSRSLRRHGIEVALATMGAPLSDDQWREIRQAPNVRVYENTFKLEWMEAPWDDVACAGKRLLQLEEIVRPDVIHLNGYAHGSLRLHAPKLVVGHSCVLSWWEAVKGEVAPPGWNRYRHEVAAGLKAADYVITPSGAMLAALRRFYNPSLAGSVVANGRNPRFFTPGDKENFIMTVGRLWDKAKNTATLREIAHELAWPVYAAGDERHPDGAAGTEYGSGSGGKAEARFYRLGRLSPRAVASWLSRASIYALPAYYEPFGLSALEAGLSGCALVLGDIPSLREIWGDAAVFASPGDTHAIKDAIQELIGNAEYRRSMAAKARSRALGFSSHRMAEGYLAVYRALMEMKDFKMQNEKWKMKSAKL